MAGHLSWGDQRELFLTLTGEGSDIELGAMAEIQVPGKP